MTGVITQKDIIEIVRANVDILENVIEIINDTKHLKGQKQYDEETISEHIKFFYGDPDKPGKSGKPSGLINELVVANDCLLKLVEVKVADPKKVKKNAESIITSINDVLTSVEEKVKDNSTTIKEVTESVLNVKKVIHALLEVSRDICILALISPIVTMAAILAIATVVVIMAFVWVVNELVQMIVICITDEDLKDFDRIKTLCTKLLIIGLEVILLALISPAIALAAIIALLAIGILTLCVWGITALLNIMVKMIKKVYDELAMVALFFMALILILAGLALGMLAVALIAVVVLESIIPIIIFIVMLIVIVTLLTTIGFILGKMQSILMQSIVGLVLVMIIMGIMVGIAITLMITALCAQVVVEHIVDLLIFFATMIVIVVLLAAIGFALTYASVILAMSIGGLALVIAVLTELLVISVLLSILALFDFDEEKINENISIIIGAVYHVALKLMPLMLPWVMPALMFLNVNMALITAVVTQLLVLTTLFRLIQAFDIIPDKLYNNIDTIIGAIYRIALKLMPFTNPIIILLLLWMFENTVMLSGVVSAIVSIGRKIEKIAKLEIEEEVVTQKIGMIFNVIDTLTEKYGNPVRNVVLKLAMKQAKKMMRKVKKIVKHLTSIAEYISRISKLELEQQVVQQKMNIVFGQIDYITEKYGDKKRNKKLKRAMRQAKKMMKKVKKLFGFVEEIAEIIKTIGEMEMSTTKVKKNFKIVFGQIDYVTEKYNNKKRNKKLKKAMRQAKKMMEQISCLMGYVHEMAKMIEEISKMEINKRRAKKNLDITFSVIDDICGRYGNKKRNKKLKKALKQAKKMMDHVKEIVGHLGAMVKTLSEIADIKLDSKKIDKNLDFLWKVVEDVRKKIQERFAPKSDEKGLFAAVKGWWKKRQEKKQTNEFLKELGKVGEIIKVLGTITSTLESIQNIKINKKKIDERLKHIWAVIEDVRKKIQERFAPKSDEGGVFGAIKGWWRRRQQAKRTDDFLKEMGSVGEIVKVLGTVAETLKLIQDIKINDKKIDKNMNYIWKVVDQIRDKIKKRFAPKSDEGGIFGAIKGWWRRRKQAKRTDDFLKEMGKVGEIVKSLGLIAETLKLIQDIKIDDKKLDANMEYIWKIVDQVRNKIKERFKPKSDEKGLWGAIKGWFRRRREKRQTEEFNAELGKIAQIMGSLKIVTESLKSIQDFKVDGTEAINKIDELFNIVDAVVDHVKKRHAAKMEEANKAKDAAYWSTYNSCGKLAKAFGMADNWANQAGLAAFTEVMEGDKKAADAFLSSLGPTVEILTALSTVVESLKTICKYRIVTGSVIQKINNIFDTVEQIQQAMNKRIEDRANKNRGVFGSILSKLGFKPGKKALDAAMQSLSEEGERAAECVETMLDPATTIVTALTQYLENLKGMTVATKDVNMDTVFGFMDKCVGLVDQLAQKLIDYSKKDFNALTIGEERFVHDLDAYKEIFESAAELANSKGANLFTSLTLSSLCSVLERMVKVKQGVLNFLTFTKSCVSLFKAFDKVDIKKLKHVTEILSKKVFAKMIAGFEDTQKVVNFQIFTKSSKTLLHAINGVKLVKLFAVGKFMSKHLPRTMRGFISTNSAKNYENFVSNSIKLLQKINDTDIEKLGTTVKLFKSMAQFSESINGNFEKLADTLNEKIAPLLEELRDLIEGVGEGGSGGSAGGSEGGEKKAEKPKKKDDQLVRALSSKMDQINTTLKSLSSGFNDGSFKIQIP